MQTPVIYRPHLGSFNAPLGLSAPTVYDPSQNRKRRSSNQDIGITSVMFYAGVNWVKDTDLQRLTVYPISSDRLTELSRKRILEIKTPVIPEGVEAEEWEGTGTTLDYSLGDARDLIEATYDVEWLRLCQVKDARREIASWVQARIAEIEEAKNKV